MVGGKGAVGRETFDTCERDATGSKVRRAEFTSWPHHSQVG